MTALHLEVSQEESLLLRRAIRSYADRREELAVQLRSQRKEEQARHFEAQADALYKIAGQIGKQHG